MNKNRLHRFRNIAAALLACVGFASCSQDELAEKDTSLPTGKYPLELTASIGEAVVAPATRGTAHDTWPYSGRLRIVSSIDQDEDNINWFLGTQYSYNVYADGTVKLDYSRYWQKSDERLHIYAGPSRMLGLQGYQPWSVRTDQSTEIALNESDYFTAYGILTFHEKEHTLEFRHLTSKITVNLKQSDYLKAQDPNAVKVTLNTTKEQWYIEGSFRGQPQEIRLEAEEERGQAGIITPYTYKAPDPAAEGIYATYEAILIPQQITDTGKTIQVKVGNTTYSYEIKCDNGKFSSGEEWIYNITVNANKLDVTVGGYNASIDWGADGATGSGNVELP